MPTVAPESLRQTLRNLCTRMDLPRVYEVGGCLRDELLGRAATDIDLAVTGVTADDLLARARRVGHAGELTVAGQLIGVRLQAPGLAPEGVELALARTEASTGPGHTDFAIHADPGVTIEQDLARRDFTINAIARDLYGSDWIDPHDGRGDVERRLLRTVAPIAFRDDPLRILRGLARVARDGLAVEPRTWLEMLRYAGAFQPSDPADAATWTLSPERVFAEYEKALGGQGATRAFTLARDLGILRGTIPEWADGIGYDQESRFHELTVDEHELLALHHAARWEAGLDVRWAALLHDCGKPASAWRGPDDRLHYYANPRLGNRSHEAVGAERARDALSRLRAPNQRIDRVGAFVDDHMFSEDRDIARKSPRRQATRARRFLYRVGRDRARQQLLLRRCDRIAKSHEPAPGWDRDIADFEALVERHWDDPVTVRELAVDGHDLVAAGFEGRRVGEVQRVLIERVMADPADNTRERLLDWARRLA